MIFGALCSIGLILCYGVEAATASTPICDTATQVELVSGRWLSIPRNAQAHVELESASCKLRTMSASLPVKYNGKETAVRIVANFSANRLQSTRIAKISEGTSWVAHRRYPVHLEAQAPRSAAPSILMKKNLAALQGPAQVFDCTITGGYSNEPPADFPFETVRGFCYTSLYSNEFSARVSLNIREVPYFDLMIPQILNQLKSK